MNAQHIKNLNSSQLQPSPFT